VPTELSDQPPTVRRAVAWALGRHGFGPDRFTSAALTLAVHHLMGASYPSGRLDVDRLGAAALSGFEGNEEEVLSRARAIKTDALAHAHLRRPFRLSLHAQPVRPGQAGVLTARLTDAVGNGVSGVALLATAAVAKLSPGAASAATDAAGGQRFRFVASTGENRFHVNANVPDVELRSFAPASRRAQRVARPGRVPVSAGAGFTAQVRRLSIRKVGDASAYLSLAGARFQVRHVATGGELSAPVGQLVTNAGGGSSWLELDPGVYQVTEVAAPAGYKPGGPWTVDLTRADAVLEVANAARPGTATITKVDADSGKAVAGATLALAYDADRDGSFETGVGRLVSGPAGTHRELRPGDYELREISPPPGYQGADKPVRFSVPAGRQVAVTMSNAPVRAPTPATTPRPPEARRPESPRRAPSATLPDTGGPLCVLALAGAGLVVSGGILTAAGRGLRRAKRSAGR
jgi:hypothetical protein